MPISCGKGSFWTPIAFNNPIHPIASHNFIHASWSNFASFESLDIQVLVISSIHQILKYNRFIPSCIQFTIWRSDNLIVNLRVLFATLLEKLFWGFQWSRGCKLWPNYTVNTKFCVRTFLGAFNNKNCWNCQHSHHHEVFSHLFPFCISICML